MNDSTNTADAVIATKQCSMYDLWQQAWSRAGKSLFYMQFIHPEDNESEQATRVHAMCYHLATEWRNYYKDTPENREWFAEWIRIFWEETENQC